MSKAPPTTSRLLLIIPGGLALLGGLNGALMLLDVPAPLDIVRLRDGHGIILVIGFVGTLIAVERAVALRRWWGFLAPISLGLGALLVMSPAPVPLGRSLLIAGALGLVFVYIPLWRRHNDATVLVQLMGAVLMAGSAILWVRDVPPAVFVPWLAGFVILTISAERIELARVGVFDAALRERADSNLLWFGHALFATAVSSVLWPQFATQVFGIVLLALVAWLTQTDVARKLIKSTGAQRYMAACLLSGYVWLSIAALTWIMVGHVDTGRAYDAVIHAVFLGFTMTMIFAHAPVILPAVLRRPLPYRPYMYGPLVLLHIGLILRILIGDVFDIDIAHQVGGVLNVIALLAFVVGSVWSVVSATRAQNAARANRASAGSANTDSASADVSNPDPATPPPADSGANS